MNSHGEEKLILGAVMAWEHSHEEIFSRCHAEYFSLDSHRKIFAGMLNLRKAGKSLDYVSIGTLFGEKLASIGGMAYLMELHDGSMKLKSYLTHLTTLRDTWRRRDAIGRAERALQKLNDTSIPISEAIEPVVDIKSAPSDTPSQEMLIPPSEFMANIPSKIDWMVKGVIERGANGIFAAVPKGGKSWAALDMAISLALGMPWLGFDIPRQVRTALISREDNPGLTKWRACQLFAGKGATNPDLLAENLHINSREQSPEMMLDNGDQLAGLIGTLKAKKIEFCFLDVFNVMHAADENDNTDMRQIMRKLSMIQSEVGCNVGIIHHFSKNESGSITQRLRGASAISGWYEWVVAITMADEDTKTRRMEFELKAAQPPVPIHYRIESNDHTARLELSEYEIQPTRGRSRAAQLMQ